MGTTTIAVNLAVALAQQGQRSLLFSAPRGGRRRGPAMPPGAATRSGQLCWLETRPLAQALHEGPAGVQILPVVPELVRWHERAEHAWNASMTQLASLSPRPEVVVIDAGSRPDPLARSSGRRPIACVGKQCGDGGDHGCLCLDQAAERSEPSTSIALVVNLRSRIDGRRGDSGWPGPAGGSWDCACGAWACRKTAPCRNLPRAASHWCWQCRHARPACMRQVARAMGKRRAAAA